MKRILSIGLVVVVVLSLGAMAFADEVETTFQKGFGRGANMSEDFERGTGVRQSMTDEAFEAYRAENRVNLSLNFEASAEAIDLLADLTGVSVEAIEDSGLTLHEYAEKAEKLEAFQAALLTLKTNNLETLVENGTISEDKADFMLDRMSQMDGSHLQERLGQKGGGRGFNGKGHGGGFNR